MSISREEAREFAERILETHNEDVDFCLVYENDEVLEEFPDIEDHRAIWDEIAKAKVTVTWDD